MVVDAARLSSWAQEARRRTIELYADLSDRAMAVPYLRIINPPVWELGHVAWFQEHWVPVGDASALAALLRRCEEEPGFLAELRARVLALQPLVGHARERTSWRELVQELGISPTRDVRR